jgi:hypothetical protein
MALDHRITRRARFTSTPQCTCLYDRRLSGEGKSHAGGSSRSSEQRVRFARFAGLRLPRKALNLSMKSWPRQPFKPLRAQPRRSGRGASQDEAMPMAATFRILIRRRDLADEEDGPLPEGW